jgi:hypothetical protein
MEMILGCQTEHCLNRLSSPPIAAIIKNGLTGPQIADLLHISPDTEEEGSLFNSEDRYKSYREKVQGYR